MNSTYQIKLFFILIIPGLFSNYLQSQIPSSFNDNLVSDKWATVVGLTFDETGRMYAWTKEGKVHLMENGNEIEDPLIDISEEVATYGDHGLLGFALHPNFQSNGYFYLLYAVDRHHLIHFGTPAYSPNKNTRNQATIGRVTRYTADSGNDFKSIVPGSRKILIGETKKTGIPLLHISHGVGSLIFGTDGTLFVSAGDGATFAGSDIGGTSAETYNFQALEDSIIRTKEDVGAFRSQLVDALNGKILRIDPQTGDGVPSNPFYDPIKPRSPKSRVWALGFRNPYRIKLKPGTGSHNPEDGNPGTLYAGDVGWAYWEELNIIDRPGMNFGWPLYEGMKSRWQYFWKVVYNYDAPNDSYDPSAGCHHHFFWFKELLFPATSNPTPFFFNPCSPGTEIPSNIPAFVHQRPVITWSNSDWNTEEQGTHIPGFDSLGNGIFYSINSQESPVKSDTFNGFCAISGTFYTGTTFPSSFQNQFLGADMKGWVKKFGIDESQNLTEIEPLINGIDRVIHLEMNPSDECIYYIRHQPYFDIRKICYGGNQPPTAKVKFSPQYGASPLAVNFDASESFDPENGSLVFHWDFGDGDNSNLVNPVHVFNAPNNEPTFYQIKLTVSDSLGEKDEEELIVSLNNTPPNVKITSLEQGDRYPISGSTLQPLQAEASDMETSTSDLSFKWEVFFHHNTHVHPETPDENRESAVILSPEGCGEEDFWYRIRLTVSDPHGLAGVDEVEIYPYCDSPFVKIKSFETIAEKQSVNLEWVIDEYKSGISFVIQRSENLTSFEDIGEISAKPGQTTFSFDDIYPLLGSNFYRIKILGPDKWYDYSPLRIVKFPVPKFIEIYPNPFRNEISIVFEKIEETAFLEIFDLRGKTLFNTTFEAYPSKITHSLLFDKWGSGIYLYRISVGGNIYSGKIIKE